jgi:hypothetical protein
MAPSSGESRVEQCGQTKASFRSHRSSPLCRSFQLTVPRKLLSFTLQIPSAFSNQSLICSLSPVSNSPTETFTCIVAEAPCSRSRLNYASHSQLSYLLPTSPHRLRESIPSSIFGSSEGTRPVHEQTFFVHRIGPHKIPFLHPSLSK